MTQHSQTITRKSGSNLAQAFVLLPKPKRHAMSALYAFCREVDDVADDESRPLEDRRADLGAWRKDVRLACDGGSPQFAVNRELQPVIAQYHLPYGYFDELVQGVEMDLDINRYKTYEELELYCYRVASVVGLLSIEIFGYRNPECRPYAIALGKALQLTNIVRDVRGDAERGRIYLPLCELERHNVSAGEILGLKYSDRYARLAASVANKAKAFYAEAARTLPKVDRRAMIAAELMGSVYWRLLMELEGRRFDVFGGVVVRLNRGQKLALIFRTWTRLAIGATAPNYGQETCAQ
ncbi:MAG TPA: presqualene diphosphate synthase HpnD [Verrucomicrobiae bacterium]|jgi:phytoene synthase|nr:presqualene diphosphate synthase HpnD [Verrucomicrobiae bacterium]